MPTTDPGGTRDGSPAAPEMPSFESLRDRRQHSAVDLLVPRTPRGAIEEPAPQLPFDLPVEVPAERPLQGRAEPPVGVPADEDPPPAGAAVGGRAADAGGPRPAEYGDLLRLGGRLLGAAAGIPLRLASCCLRSLLHR